jgi:hypothetical protein
MIQPAAGLLAMLAFGGCENGDRGMDASASGSSESGDGSACGGNRRPPGIPTDEAVDVSLVDHELWEQLDADADPLAEHRPEMVDCGPLGWEVEFDGFEVETIGCNYMAASQPSLVELCAGDQLHFDFQHFNLVSSGPAQAHAAVYVGEQALLEYTVDIDPDTGTAARKWDEMIEVEQDVPAGGPVYLHIHNHGFNTYKLLKVDLVLAPGE